MINLGQKINSRENNFDFLRFLAAYFVIISHNYRLWGFNEPSISGYVSLGGVGVFIFFLISGFLITKSWMNKPKAIDFFWNRALRIFPALILLTLFTSFILGPLVTSLPIIEYFQNQRTWEYIKNIFIYDIKFNLPGVFVENPYPNAVNGSIWTLPIEFLMYIGIAVIGLIGLINKKFFFIITILIIIFLCFFSPVSLIKKMGIYFFIGSFYYIYRDKIYLDSKLAVLSLVIFILSIGTQNVFLISFITLPYLIFYFAYGIDNYRLKNFGKYGDFSYGLYIYAFPVQQTLIYFFRERITFVMFSLTTSIIIFVFAVLSWHLIEKNALKLKSKKPWN